MTPAIIKNYTRILGKEQGYTGLPVRDETIECSVGGEVSCMVSEYELTDEELRLICDGGRIRLYVQGTVHPPVRLEVIDPVEDLFA